MITYSHRLLPGRRLEHRLRGRAGETSASGDSSYPGANYTLLLQTQSCKKQTGANTAKDYVLNNGWAFADAGKWVSGRLTCFAASIAFKRRLLGPGGAYHMRAPSEATSTERGADRLLIRSSTISRSITRPFGFEVIAG